MTILTTIPRLRVIASLLATLAVVACGGGGSSGSPDPVAQPGPGSPPAPATEGVVGIMLTDAPADDFDRYLATLTGIQVRTKDGLFTLFSGRTTVDLKQLAHFSEPFAIGPVPSGSIDRIYLQMEALELLDLDQTGAVVRSVQLDLPGSGRLELDPGEEFLLAAGASLVLEIDFDMDHAIEREDDGYRFRPVVNITRIDQSAGGEAGQKATRMVGIIGEVEFEDDGVEIELCQSALVSQPDDDEHFEDHHCLDVEITATTAVFGPDAAQMPIAEIAPGMDATVIGYFRRDSEEDDDEAGDEVDHDNLDLHAVVLEIGDPSAFHRVPGRIVSADTSPDGSFVIDVADGIGTDDPLAASLQPGALIFSVDGEMLDPSALRENVNGQFEGLILEQAAGSQLLRTTLAILDPDKAAEESIRGIILDSEPVSRRLTIADSEGDRCVDVSEDADIFLLFDAPGGGVVSERGGFTDLNPGRTADAYGHWEDGGCFAADTVIADETAAAPGLLPPPENRAPIADAGADRAITTGEGVLLDGTGSMDPDGDALNFSWTLSAPGGSNASLSAADTAAPSFVADVDGSYAANLVVNDGELDSGPDTVTVTASSSASNRDPVADAGPDQSVETGQSVTLDGTGSTDPDGDPLSYLWSLAAPAGSAASLSAADTATPGFTADVTGEYLVSLVVNDGSSDSAPDSVMVTAVEPAPPAPDGQALYQQNCSGCHGPLASSEVSGASAQAIQQAIDANKGNMGFLSFLTQAEIEAIAQAL